MKNTEVKKIHYWSALVGQLGRSKNNHSHLKLILSCSLLKVILYIKFHINWMKNTEVKKIHYWSALVVSWVGQKIAVAIQKTFVVVLSPMLPPVTNFTQIG